MLYRIFIFIAGMLCLSGIKAQNVCVIDARILKDTLRFTSQRIEKVYLTQVDEYDRLVPVDSALLQSGRFRFERMLPEGAPRLMYFITGFDNGQIPVFVEPGNVNILLRDGAYPGGARVTGTETNELYNAYKAISEKCTQAQNDSLRILSQRYGEKWMDEEEGMMERMRIGAAELIECNAERIRFLIAHNDSPLAPLMMEREIAYMLDKRYAEWLLKSLSPVLKDHPYYRSFGNMVRAQDLKVGGELPDITIPLIEGTKVNLNNYRGKYVLLDFWASWCAPCLKEIPNLIQIYDEAKAKNADFLIVSFSLDNKEKAWKDAIVAKGMDKPGWIHGSDLLGWGSPAARLMGVSAIPQTILIDPEGKAVSFSLRGEEMVRRIRQILSGGL
ncbi:AhpC/TSA family protein [Bacteroides pyogenes]|nr:AhpC/TSA family protein [Bacteroides pyogenes]